MITKEKYAIFNRTPTKTKKGYETMRKLFLLSFLIMLLHGAAGASDVPVDIRVNGEYIKTDSEPIIRSGVTYAPIRAIADSLGAHSVSWNENTKTATVNIDSKVITVKTGSRTACSDGKAVSLNGNSFILNNRTYIPVRAMSNLFNAKVNWDGQYYNVEITKTSTQVPDNMIDRSFTHDELYWLAKIINAESGGEIQAGKVAVGDVILNRVKSPLFPNTIYGVIFDTTYSVQFEPIINGSIYENASIYSIAAAKTSLTNSSTVGKCLYFLNPTSAQSSWIQKNRVYYKTIGNHDFYL